MFYLRRNGVMTKGGMYSTYRACMQRAVPASSGMCPRPLDLLSPISNSYALFPTA